jgi:hypothetical protein
MVSAALSTPAGVLNVMASARLGKPNAIAKMALANAASKAYLRMYSSWMIESLNDQVSTPSLDPTTLLSTDSWLRRSAWVQDRKDLPSGKRKDI